MFARKHSKKGLKKVQDNSTKAMNARAEALKALVKPKEIRPKILNGGSCKLSQLAYIAPLPTSLQAQETCWCHIAKDLRLYRPKAKAQTKAQAMPVAQAPKGAPKPTRQL